MNIRMPKAVELYVEDPEDQEHSNIHAETYTFEGTDVRYLRVCVTSVLCLADVTEMPEKKLELAAVRVRKRVDSEAAVRKQAAEEAAKKKAKEDKEHGAAAEKEPDAMDLALPKAGDLREGILEILPELPTEPNNREKMAQVLTNLKGGRCRRSER